MKTIEISITGKVIYKRNDDITDEEIKRDAIGHILYAEQRINKDGLIRIHINTGTKEDIIREAS